MAGVQTFLVSVYALFKICEENSLTPMWCQICFKFNIQSSRRKTSIPVTSVLKATKPQLFKSPSVLYIYMLSFHSIIETSLVPGIWNKVNEYFLCTGLLMLFRGCSLTCTAKKRIMVYFSTLESHHFPVLIP